MLVLFPVKRHKMQNSWERHYEVVERETEVTYQIQKHHSKVAPGTVHINRLKAYHSTIVNMIGCTEGESERTHRLVLMAECQDGSSSESTGICKELTRPERADILTALQSHKQIFSSMPEMTPNMEEPQPAPSKHTEPLVKHRSKFTNNTEYLV